GPNNTASPHSWPRSITIISGRRIEVLNVFGGDFQTSRDCGKARAPCGCHAVVMMEEDGDQHRLVYTQPSNSNSSWHRKRAGRPSDEILAADLVRHLAQARPHSADAAADPGRLPALRRIAGGQVRGRSGHHGYSGGPVLGLSSR